MCLVWIKQGGSTTQDSGGNLVCGHDQKASILWNDFKERMGVSGNPIMLFNLEVLMHRTEDLSSLVLPVTEIEVSNIVASLPVDKAPDADGFNGLFLKKCWPIIKMDVFQLCREFFISLSSLACLNSSFITLVQKCSLLFPQMILGLSH